MQRVAEECGGGRPCVAFVSLLILRLGMMDIAKRLHRGLAIYLGWLQVFFNYI